MSQNYYVYVKPSCAGIDFYPIKKTWGEFIKQEIHKDWNCETTSRKALQFIDPSLVIVYKTKAEEEGEICLATATSDFKIFGSFVVVTTTIDGIEPELLTWGQAVLCFAELIFLKDLPKNFNL